VHDDLVVEQLCQALLVAEIAGGEVLAHDTVGVGAIATGGTLTQRTDRPARPMTPTCDRS